jgi:hypothetical protein
VKVGIAIIELLWRVTSYLIVFESSLTSPTVTLPLTLLHACRSSALRISLYTPILNFYILTLTLTLNPQNFSSSSPQSPQSSDSPATGPSHSVPRRDQQHPASILSHGFKSQPPPPFSSSASMSRPALQPPLLHSLLTPS